MGKKQKVFEVVKRQESNLDSFMSEK